MEHTEDLKTAVEIALDHIYEFPTYYTELDKMEQSLKDKDVKKSYSKEVLIPMLETFKKDELLKDLDIMINTYNSDKTIAIMSDLKELKGRLKDKIYEGLKDFCIAIDSHSEGINIIEFIKFRMKSE